MKLFSLLRKTAQTEQYKAIHAAAKKMEPSTRKSFLIAVKKLRDSIVLDDLEQALITGRIDAALEVVNIGRLEGLLRGAGIDPQDPVYQKQLTLAFEAGAIAAISNLPKQLQLSTSFNLINPRAVSYINTWTGQSITNITKATEKAVSGVILRGQQDGLPVKTQARLIKELVGTTPPQTMAIYNFRQQLIQQTNTPVDMFGNTINGKQADTRRLSATEQAVVRRHMKEGNLTQSKIDDLVLRYHDSLIRKRANDISRTETLNAANAGQQELWEQMRDDELLPPDVRRKWIITPDDRLRESHAAIPRMNPKGAPLTGKFLTPFGPVIGPHDSNSNLINCRCAIALINLEAQ